MVEKMFGFLLIHQSQIDYQLWGLINSYHISHELEL